MRLRAFLPAFLAVTAVTAVSSGATFTVDTTADGPDANPGDGVCATAGAVCTLRAAIEEANTTPDLDTIAFAIAGPGVQTLRPTSDLPEVTQPVVIDGFTQPGSQPNTSWPGINAVLLIELDLSDGDAYAGLVIAGGNSTVRGLVVNGDRGLNHSLSALVFRARGGNAVEGCFIGTNADGTAAPRAAWAGVQLDIDTSANRIGGTEAAQRNLISGHRVGGISFSCLVTASCHSGTTIAGNLIGTNASGTAALPNGYGIYGRPSGVTIGGPTGPAMNVVSGNDIHGIYLSGMELQGAVILGNRIGTTADGTQPLPNGSGLFLSAHCVPCGLPSFSVGGAGAGNVIAFNRGQGIVFQGTGTISGNTIESNALGIYLSTEATADISDNTVAANTGNGVSIYGYSIYNPQARLSGNSIRDNGGLGIDLLPNGVTPNDPGDGDTGPNGLQNYPVLTSACTGGGAVTVLGTLNSQASSAYTIELFRNAACDPTEYGEGEEPLGSTTVATGPDGNVSFVATLARTVNVGEFVTATATAQAGTSEFSRCIPVTVAAPPPAQSISGSASVCAGMPFALQAVAGANSYEWFLGGVPIPGATGVTYGKSGASVGDAGAYTVRAANCDLSSTSPPHVLSVVPCLASPLRLDVDRHSAAGTSSDLNGILEPSEVVLVEPRYLNTDPSPLALTGAASLTGPAGGVYALPDAAADYGTVAPAQASDCFGATGDCYRASVSAPGGRPTRHWDALFEETTSGGNPLQPWPLHIGETFDDVARTHPFYRFVEALVHGGVTGGCSTSDYCPTTSTSREQMAVFVLVAREGPFYQPPACDPALPRFGDVAASSPFCRWVEELARRGVVGGCQTNEYCPSSSVRRDQMAVFALATREAPGYTPPACVAGSEIFADVPASSPFCRWVEELQRRGVVGGCGNGNYCPQDPVSRGEMSVFVAETFGLLVYGP